ncbi:MAG: class I SAM-dependent methyltransferase [Actinobacteria bacterium]|nr:class I SAM-dependent methyltransferase [Actinomycetota bacterium]
MPTLRRIGAQPTGPRQRRGIRRSIALFASFRVEQTDPDRFYGDLATDSLAALGEWVDVRDKVVLDVGAGPAQFAAAFRAGGARYVPLDHDPGVPSVADGGIVGSADALPVASGGVDVVFCSNVLEHVEHVEPVADELVRVLRPGGVLYLSYTNWLSPWGGHETSPWHYVSGDYAIRRYRAKHGKLPKNRLGENLFRTSVADVLRWAGNHPDVEVLVARPRYLPDLARHVLAVPVLREFVTWNLLLILRRRPDPTPGTP